MNPQVFEVVLDHNDPNHHDQMTRMARDLRAWASRVGTTKLIREHREIRPGVMRIRFTPDKNPGARRIHQDRLTLSRPRVAR